MSFFLDWLTRLSILLEEPAAWGIFLAGAFIYVINEWRIRYIALVLQYVLIGLLFARIFDTRPEMALMKIAIGWIIATTLLISARIRQKAKKETLAFRWAANMPFRVLSLAAATVIAYFASAKYPLPYVSPDLGLACFLLLILAVLFFGTEEEDPAIVGVGVLNLLAALDIFYSSQEPGLLVSGMLVIVNLLVGLACSYLTVAEGSA